MNQEIVNQTFVSKCSDSAEVSNKTFKKCVFKNIEGILSIKNTEFIDCIFEECKVEGLFLSDVKILNGKISHLSVGFSNFRRLTVKNTSILCLDCETSSLSDCVFEDGYAESIDFKKMVISSSCFGYSRIKKLFINKSSFIDVLFVRCSFFEKNKIIGTFFDDDCRFMKINFSSLEGSGDNTFFKNSIFGIFCDCTNRDHFDDSAVCPKEGSFIGYKMCLYRKGDNNHKCIVTLRIIEGAKRLGFKRSGKCRCSKAEVLKVETFNGDFISSHSYEVFSSFDPKFTYKVGQIVEPINGFDENEEVECGAGIHFFMTKDEAKSY